MMGGSGWPKLGFREEEGPLSERERETMQPSQRLRAHRTQLNVFCGAIVGGVVIFAGVVWFLLRTGAMPPQDLELPTWMSPLFNVVALVALLKAQLLPRLFGTPPPGAPEGDWLAWQRRTTMVGFALRDAAALIALVGAVLTGRWVGALFMVGLAILAMVLTWPREAQLPG